MSCTSLISHVLRGVESEACDMEFSQGDHIQLQVAGGQSPLQYSIPGLLPPSDLAEQATTSPC
jgi:hypothetical protein